MISINHGRSERFKILPKDDDEEEEEKVERERKKISVTWHHH